MSARKPARLKILSGNVGKRPLGTPPQVEASLPRCPSWLSPEARKLWEEIGPELVKAGLLTALDRAAFTALCSTYGSWRAALAIVERDGETYQAGDLRKRHPAVAIAAQAARDMLTLCKEFGMTPKARQGLDVNLPNELDDFEKLMAEYHPDQGTAPAAAPRPDR